MKRIPALSQHSQARCIPAWFRRPWFSSLASSVLAYTQLRIPRQVQAQLLDWHSRFCLSLPVFLISEQVSIRFDALDPHYRPFVALVPCQVARTAAAARIRAASQAVSSASQAPASWASVLRPSVVPTCTDSDCALVCFFCLRAPASSSKKARTGDIWHT